MGNYTTIPLHRKSKMKLRSELPIDLHKNTLSLFEYRVLWEAYRTFEL